MMKLTLANQQTLEIQGIWMQHKIAPIVQTHRGLYTLMFVSRSALRAVNSSGKWKEIIGIDDDLLDELGFEPTAALLPKGLK